METKGRQTVGRLASALTADFWKSLNDSAYRAVSIDWANIRKVSVRLGRADRLRDGWGVFRSIWNYKFTFD